MISSPHNSSRKNTIFRAPIKPATRGKTSIDPKQKYQWKWLSKNIQHFFFEIR